MRTPQRAEHVQGAHLYSREIEELSAQLRDAVKRSVAVSTELVAAREQYETAARLAQEEAAALREKLALAHAEIGELIEAVGQIARREDSLRRALGGVAESVVRLRRSREQEAGGERAKGGVLGRWLRGSRHRRSAERADDTQALAAVEEAARARDGVRLLVAKGFVMLPLSKTPQRISVGPAPRPKEIWLTYLGPDGSCRATIECRAGTIARDDSGQARRLELRSGRPVRLGVLANVERETILHVHRVRGEFGVLKVALHAVESAAPKEPLDVPARPAGELGATLLDGKLWGGYAEYALPALEGVRDDERAAPADRAKAAWYLARWWYVHGEAEKALESLAVTRRSSAEPPLRERLLEAQCLDALGRHREALDAIDEALATQRSVDLLLLRSTAAANLERERSQSRASADSVRLEGLNAVLRRHGLAELRKRDPDTPLNLSNVRCEIARTVDDAAKVSVIMPAFNAARTIRWAIESVLSQTWRNIELLVVDDASTDDTARIVEEIAAKDQRVRLIAKSVNEGAYAARNTGLAHATGELVTVHDSDDWSHPEQLERQVAALRSHPEAVAVKSHWVRVSYELDVLGPWVPKGTFLDLNFSSLLVGRRLITELGGWDDVVVGGDAELYSRLQSLFGSDSVILLPRDMPLALALTREDSLTRSKATHLRTLYYGLRWNYLDAYQHWHSRIAEMPGPHSPRSGQRRRFPVPLGNRPGEKGTHQYDVVIAADLAHDDDLGDRLASIIEGAAGIGRRLALFHWRAFERSPRAPVLSRYYEACLRHDIDILSVGDAVATEVLLVGGHELLEHKIEPRPQISANDVVVLVGNSADHALLELDAAKRRNAESMFGRTPRRLALSDMEGAWSRPPRAQKDTEAGALADGRAVLDE